MADKEKEAAASASASAPAPPATIPFDLKPLPSPPEIKDPISYTTSAGLSIYYSKATQQYFLIITTTVPATPTTTSPTAPATTTTIQYYHLHTVPPQTLPKSAATKLLQSSKSFDALCAAIQTSYPKLCPPASAQVVNAILPAALIPINAVHDSLLVVRVRGTTPLAQLFVDKYPIWGPVRQNFLYIFRPDYVAPCSCSELESPPGSSNILYCKGCTSYYNCIITSAPDGKSATMQHQKITTVGTLALTPPLACEVLQNGMCGGTTRLVMDRAFLVLAQLFRFTAWSALGGLGREQVLYWALRDSLFVAFPNVKVCWYDQWFGERAHAAAAGGGNQAGMNGVAAAVGLARLGLAIATLGMIS